MDNSLEKKLWWNYVHEDLRELLLESVFLIKNVGEWEKSLTGEKYVFHDYSFIVFPAAKAYEGFLKTLFLDLGFTISFTGVITFARDYDETIKNAPLAMIMSETDAPYVTPIPFRGKRNEPLYVQEVVKKIAEIRGEDIEKVQEVLVKNAQRVFLSSV